MSHPPPSLCLHSNYFYIVKLHPCLSPFFFLELQHLHRFHCQFCLLFFFFLSIHFMFYFCPMSDSLVLKFKFFICLSYSQPGSSDGKLWASQYSPLPPSGFCLRALFHSTKGEKMRSQKKVLISESVYSSLTAFDCSITSSAVLTQLTIHNNSALPE